MIINESAKRGQNLRASCSGREHNASKADLVLFALVVSLYLKSYDFSVFLAIFGIRESVDEQLYIYGLSTVLFIMVMFMYAICALFSRRLENPLLTKRSYGIFACAMGFVGNVFLVVYQYAPFMPVVLVSFIFLSIYIALSLFSLGSRAVRYSISDLGFMFAIIGCFVSAFSILNAAVPSTGICSITLAAIAIALSFLRFPPLTSDELACYDGRKESCSNSFSNGSLVAIFIVGIFFCIFASVYPRLITTPIFGGIAFFERLYIGIFAFSFFVLYAIWSVLKPLSYRYIHLLFLALSAILMLSFLIAVILISQGLVEFGTGTIKANETLLTIFLFFVTVVLIRYNKKPFIPTLSVFGALVLSFPDLLINGILKPFNFAFQFYQSPFLIPLTASVAFVVVLVANIFIMRDFNHGKNGSFDGSDTSAKAIMKDIASQSRLTERESDVFYLLAQGHSVKRIAEVLYISPSTVQTHARSIYKKVGVHSRQDLIDHVNANGRIKSED